MLYEAHELYNKLIKEKVEGHYFRGQPREYPGPLWPSAYRPLISSADCLSISNDTRLRKSGTRFNLKMDMIDWVPFKSEKEYKKFVLKEQMKLFVKNHTRNALGYVLSEALFQQIGIRSEGLDVTSDVRIAFFFAIYDWGPNGYRLKQNSSEPCVIYRWNYHVQSWSIEDLNRYNFYSCPPVIPVHKIFPLFEKCENNEECQQSLSNYKKAIKWNMFDFDLSSIEGKRPFHLIKLPNELAQNSRFMRQKASLLIPDAVRSEDFLRTHLVKSPQVFQEIQQGSFVEDLSQNPCCERFYFDLNSAMNLEWVEDISPALVFPKDDLLFILLRDWMRTLIRNPYGTLPVFADMPPEITYDDFMNYLLNDFENQFFS